MGDYKDYSSYFVPESSLFGGFPKQAQVDELISLGVRYFIDLTFPEEVNTKYVLPENCFYINYSIPDRGIPISVSKFTSLVLFVYDTISNGNKVYIHCKGGHGRSGILVAALIYLLNPGISSEEALKRTSEYHSNRKIMREKWRKMGSPQTHYQKKYIITFFSDLIFFRAYRTGSSTGFSNYSLHSVKVNENDSVYLPCGDFPTSESLFQATKNPDDKNYVQKQIQAKNPKISKSIANKIIPYKEWESKKLEIMSIIVKLKFTQNKSILNNLLFSGLRNIIYNSRTDDFFGIGSNNGSNYLGKILVEIRNKTHRNNYNWIQK
jgi:ribA/ribD-fused uncharacterized protein